MPTTKIKISVRKQGDFNFKDKATKVELNTLSGMRQMIEDIHRVSRPLTPMLTGDLRGDVIKSTAKVGNIIRGEIEWHKFYAWYQERGYTSGPVRRYTTPGTQAHFAETSVKEVTARADKYFGKKI
jgi:hypothetical protein